MLCGIAASFGCLSPLPLPLLNDRDDVGDG
jgi:hypothetical protein